MSVGTRGGGEEEEEETGEVGIADGDGVGRVNVLALALGHGELRSTTQLGELLFTLHRASRRAKRAGGLAATGGGEEAKNRPTREEARWRRGQ